jgi:RND family efflux transporter MFP subunit
LVRTPAAKAADAGKSVIRHDALACISVVFAYSLGAPMKPTLRTAPPPKIRHAATPLLLAWLLVACDKPKGDGSRIATDAAPRRVAVAVVERRPLEKVLDVVGALSVHDEAVVAAQVAGQIEKSYVDVGDRMASGQKMALIDTSAYQVLVRQAAATLARATAKADNAEQTLRRVQQLSKSGFVPTSELDQVVADAGQARADVQVAQAADAMARLNLDRSQVKSPFAGAVAERIASVGDYVAVGAPIVKVVQTDPLRLRLQVPERESIEIRVGQAVRITVEGDTKVHTGRIARIAPGIREADRVLPVEADVPNGAGLRAGLFVRAQIVIDAADEGLTVPARSLVTFAGLEKVVQVKDGKAIEKTVVTGRRGEGWIEIVKGLGGDETVAVQPAGLRTGQAVQVEGRAPAPISGGGGASL